MQLLNLTPKAAKELADALKKICQGDTDVMVLDRVEIRCGDASGSPDGWGEVEVRPVFKQTILPICA